MRPVLVSLDSWEVRSYDFVLFLAIALGLFLFLREGRRAGIRGGDVALLGAGAAVAGLLGGRLNAWLFQVSGAVAGSGSSITSFGGGLVSFGSILGAFGFATLYARLRGWSVLGFLDLAAPIAPLSEAVNRWGCFLNGCCYGRPTEGPLGLYLPNSTGHWAHRYPTQPMLSLFCLALFAWLWRRRHRAREGQLFLLYLMIYPLGRVTIGLLRGDQRLMVGFLGVGQLTALAVVGLAAGAWNHLERGRTVPRERHR